MKTKICQKCKRTLSVNDFNKRTYKSGNIGYSGYCKKCNREVLKKHYYKNTDYYLKKASRNRKARRDWWKEYKSSLKCEFCGENFFACLEFHHKNPKDKKYNIQKMIVDSMSKENIFKEIEKCIVVCSNCHRKIHNGFFK